MEKVTGSHATMGIWGDEGPITVLCPHRPQVLRFWGLTPPEMDLILPGNAVPRPGGSTKEVLCSPGSPHGMPDSQLSLAAPMGHWGFLYHPDSTHGSPEGPVPPGTATGYQLTHHHSLPTSPAPAPGAIPGVRAQGAITPKKHPKKSSKS